MGGTSSKTPGDQPTDDPSQYQPSAIRRSTLGPTIKAVAAFKRRSLVSGLDDQMIPEAKPPSVPPKRTKGVAATGYIWANKNEAG